MARILLADDDEKLRETLLEALRNEGYDVLGASNGITAKSAFDEAAAAGNPFRLLVLDALMPKMSGFDCAKDIKAKDADVQFIFMTGVFKSPAQQQDAKDKYGSKAYLVKPFDTQRLVDAVKQVVGAPGAAPSGGGGGAGAAAAAPADPLPPDGTLLEAPVAYLLWRAHKEGHTGVLDLYGITPTGPGERLRLFFLRGKAVFGQTTDPSVNVGVELIRTGVITGDVYKNAVDLAVVRGLGLYEIIKGEGWATDAQMRPAYKLIVPKVIERAAALTGRFRYTATDQFTTIVPAASTNILDALWVGIKKATDLQLDPHINPRRPLRLAPGEAWDQVTPLLTQACGSDSLVRAINGRATIAQLIEAAPNLNERLARYRQVYLLMSTQAVQASLDPIKMDRPVAAAEPEPAGPPPASASAPRPSSPASGAPRPAPAAGGPAPGPAPRPAAGGYAPPRTNHGHQAPNQALLDEQMDKGVPFSPEEQAARTRIVAKYDEIQGKNLFEMLGVPMTADPAAVKKAYIQLARDFHPDSYSGQKLGSAKQKLTDLYSLMTEAYETLKDPGKRGEYEAHLNMSAGGGSTDVAAILGAEGDFQKGKLIIERGDTAGAFKLFEKAYAVMKNNQELEGYRLYAAWWQSNKDENEALQVIKELERCYKDAPAAHALREFQGRLYMEIGNLQKAKTCFKKVLEVEANHQGAQAAMRVLQRKIDNPPKPSGGGMFKR